MISPVLLPVYVGVSTNFVMELIKCAYCLKVQILSQWGPIAATVAGALVLVLSECYFISPLFIQSATHSQNRNILESEAFVATF